MTSEQFLELWTERVERFMARKIEPPTSYVEQVAKPKKGTKVAAKGKKKTKVAAAAKKTPTKVAAKKVKVAATR